MGVDCAASIDRVEHALRTMIKPISSSRLFLKILVAFMFVPLEKA
jgi:hypothetical protein